ncbi:MAG: porin [Polyangiaceae bacterium]|nr:porin [Polyangiaceae bacterium]
MKCSAVFPILAGLALPLTASAEEGTLSIYGTLHPFIDNYRTTGATRYQSLSPDTGGASLVAETDYNGENLPARFRMTSGTSNLGFKGELPLSDQFRAFFQVENMVNIDGDSPVLTSPWANRNSAVGLKSDYGTLFFGNWDTPYKHPTLFVGPLRGLNPFDNTLTGNPGFNVPGTTTQNGRYTGRPDAAFNRRQGNSVQYWTPTWHGLSARGAISMNESRTRKTDMEPSVSPVLWSALATYELGSLSVHYAYEQHLDYFGLAWLGGATSPAASFTNRHSNDDGHEIIAWYELPTGTRLAAIVERLTYRTDEETDGLVERYQRDAVYGALQQHVGAHCLWGSFGFAGAGSCKRRGGAPCTTNGLEGRVWSVGYTYSPAKTVDIFVAWYQMENNRSATYGFYPPVVPLSPGVKTIAYGLGILYTFDFTVVGGSKPPAEAPAATAAPEPPAAEAPAATAAPEPPAAEAPAATAAPEPPAEAPAASEEPAASEAPAEQP